MEELAKEEKIELLRLARGTIEAGLTKGIWEPRSISTPGLQDPAGAFVTLHVAGNLRGCIGRIEAVAPVGQVVQEMARAAATRDPRFPPLKAGELVQLEVEISVLSPLWPVQDITEIVVGRDGLMIRSGGMSGLLLPQVASEYGWDRETFLAHTCMKAGLAPDSWQRPEAVIEAFSAQFFSEGDFD